MLWLLPSTLSFPRPLTWPGGTAEGLGPPVSWVSSRPGPRVPASPPGGQVSYLFALHWDWRSRGPEGGAWGQPHRGALEWVGAPRARLLQVVVGSEEGCVVLSGQLLPGSPLPWPCSGELWAAGMRGPSAARPGAMEPADGAFGKGHRWGPSRHRGWVAVRRWPSCHWEG